MTRKFVIPAVDIRGGRCVRLLQGSEDEQFVFSDDPVGTALEWQRQGAGMLHVVDLDGAFRGEPVNFEVIRSLIERVSIPVEVGGGIRSSDAAREYVAAGAARIVLGTRAIDEPEWLAGVCGELGEALVVGVDVRDGRVVTEGWKQDRDISPLEAVSMAREMGVRRVIYTDTRRDGMLEGPDIEGIERLAREAGVPVIASGGVCSLRDVERLWAMRDLGVEGVIVGMALYRGEFTLAEALEVTAREGGR